MVGTCKTNTYGYIQVCYVHELLSVVFHCRCVYNNIQFIHNHILEIMISKNYGYRPTCYVHVTVCICKRDETTEIYVHAGSRLNNTHVGQTSELFSFLFGLIANIHLWDSTRQQANPLWWIQTIVSTYVIYKLLSILWNNQSYIYEILQWKQHRSLTVI